MFDPLYQWFGIASKEQPPNHYRLLDLAPYESQSEAIDTAFERRMTFLHQCAGGDHAAEAEELMNMVSAARICLLDVNKKAVYDRHLRAQSVQAKPPIAPPPIPPPAPSPERVPAQRKAATELSIDTREYDEPDESTILGRYGMLGLRLGLGLVIFTVLLLFVIVVVKLTS